MKRLFYVILLASSLLINLVFFSTFVYNRYHAANPKAQSKPYTEMLEEVFNVLPNDTNEIIFLGNSITAAFGVSEYYPDLNIKNRGISGNQTSDVLRRLPEITQSKPVKLFLMIGVNDVLRGVDKETINQNYETIVKQIISDSPETKIYLQSILPISKGVSKYLFSDELLGNKTIDDLNERIKSLANELNINYVDLNLMFRLNDELNPEYSWDGIHINAKGYQLWNKMVSKFVISR